MVPVLAEGLEADLLLIERGLDMRLDLSRVAAMARIRAALADWELIKDEPVVIGRLAVIKLVADRRARSKNGVSNG